MDNENRQNFPYGYVPKNYSLMRDATSSIILNFVEGVGLATIVSLLLWQIPFVKVLKISITVIVFMLFLMFEFKGVHDYTLIVALVHYIKWKKGAKKYKLASAEETSDKGEIKSISQTSAELLNKVKKFDWKGKLATYEKTIKDAIIKDKEQ